MQSTYRYPRTVRLRYNVIPLWKREKVSAQAPIDIPGFDIVLAQPGVTQETAHTFFLPLYRQKGCTTKNDARVHFYRGHKKPPPLQKLPPTEGNLQLYVLRGHLQMLLWKIADQRDPPEEAGIIANFRWNIEGSAITSVIVIVLACRL